MQPHQIQRADADPLTSAGSVEPLVQLKGIDKIYSNGTLALRGFTLDVMPNQFVSLLGPSGCGKSTVLRMVAGLGSYTRGAVAWASTTGGRARDEVGFVFQEPNLMPWATTFDNVYLPLRLQDQRRAAVTDRVNDVLELVGLSGFAAAYPRELSGGMKMRVSIARALVTQPKLLLMDEPFASLDEITRSKLANDLLSIWQRAKCTVMFVTHSVYESVYLSQRIAVMAARPGRIIGELRIDTPYPRDTEFRLTHEYTNHCREVSALLDRAIAMQS
ncbi:MAG: ABC transporter ATP-binding protein [Xanthobacteraceae bacterium]